MKTKELLEIKRQLYVKADNLSVEKGKGYGNELDVLANLRLTEHAGVVSAEIGAWVRLCDKVMRLGRILQKGEDFVGFESFEDTVLDAINYLTYIYTLRVEKRGEKHEEKV